MNPSHIPQLPIANEVANLQLMLKEILALEDDLYLKLVKLRQGVEIAMRGATR